MLVNELSFNIKKTKYMLFSDDIILPWTHWKRWTFQIVRCDHWFKIIMGRSYPIYKKRKFPKDFEFNARLKEFYNHLRWLYYTIVSHIHLCYIVRKYGALPVKNVWCLYLEDRNVLFALPIRTETAPMFQSLELLYVFEIYTFRIAMFMYKYVYNQATDCVNELFTRANEIHDRVICQSD